VAWYLVGRRGVKADPWKRRGIGFNSSWWELTSRTWKVMESNHFPHVFRKKKGSYF
jgi:hypothetical protein